MSSAAVTVGVVVAALEAANFSLKRQRGSHMQYAHDDGRRVTVPGSRKKEEIKKGTLGAIQRNAGIRFGIYLLAGTYFGAQALLSGGINEAEGMQFAGLNRAPSVT